MQAVDQEAATVPAGAAAAARSGSLVLLLSCLCCFRSWTMWPPVWWLPQTRQQSSFRYVYTQQLAVSQLNCSKDNLQLNRATYISCSCCVTKVQVSNMHQCTTQQVVGKLLQHSASRTMACALHTAGATNLSTAVSCCTMTFHRFPSQGPAVLPLSSLVLSPVCCWRAATWVLHCSSYCCMSGGKGQVLELGPTQCQATHQA